MWMSVFRGVPRVAATFKKQFMVYVDYDVHLRRLSPRLLRRLILRPEIKKLDIILLPKGFMTCVKWTAISTLYRPAGKYQKLQ